MHVAKTPCAWILLCAVQGKEGKDACKSEPVDGAAAESMAVDKDIKESPKEVPLLPARQEPAKPDGNDNAAEGETEKAKEKEKEKKKKYKVNEEPLQAFRYFDRNCECTSSLRLLHGTLTARLCC